MMGVILYLQESLRGRKEKKVSWSTSLFTVAIINVCVEFWQLNPVLDALSAESYFRLTHVRNPVVTL